MTEQVTIDALKSLYYKYKDRLINESEITEDVTPLFWKGLRDKLIKKEQLKLVFKGQTTKGKSTAGLYVKRRINIIIKDLVQQGKIDSTSYRGDIDEYDLIAANQIEFIRIAKREGYQVCVLIDEFSPLAKSGVNATVEYNTLEWQDKVCAQYYKHPIFCTPHNDYDRYGILVLSVVDVDKSKNLTKLKLYYNDPTDYKQQFLGYVTFDVTEILNTDWYKKYRKRKMYTMNLLDEHGIKDVRELEFALVTLITFEKSLGLAQIGIKDTEIINALTDQAIRETKGIYSIMGKTEVMAKIKALLTPIVEIRRQKKIQTKKTLTYEEQMDTDYAITKCVEILQDLYLDNIKLVNLYIEYMNISSPTISEEVKEICKKYSINLNVNDVQSFQDTMQGWQTGRNANSVMTPICQNSQNGVIKDG